MLSVTGLTRSYGDFLAVENVDFSINHGEIVGLLGHNGAGKTTIMKMLSGYLEPNSGSILVDNIDLADNPLAIQSSLGYLPENLPIYPEMTVADYLDYAASLKGMNNREQKRTAIRTVVEATDIAAKLLAPIATLSRGYKQRVGVAQAILGKPKLLILDEPTNGLDPEQTQHMRQLIREIAKEATVILSTHIMQEVDALCSRVLILRSGRLAVDAALADLRQTRHLHLSTSASPKSVIKPLSALDGIEKVSLESEKNDPPNFNYTIQMVAGSDGQSIGNAIAQHIITNEHSLYQLYAEQRDLEALFRDVNEGQFNQEEMSHAA